MDAQRHSSWLEFCVKQLHDLRKNITKEVSANRIWPKHSVLYSEVRAWSGEQHHLSLHP